MAGRVCSGARSPLFGGDTLKPVKASRPLFEQHLEWTGLFLFAVGVFGTTSRGLHRHMWLWGVVPLHWFYLALLLVGAAMVLGVSPWVRIPGRDTMGPTARALRALRLAVCLAMLGAMAYFTLFH